MNNKKNALSPIKEGACPHCGANLNFSEKDRSKREKISCPKCKKEFGVEEARVLEKKKKGKGCLIAIIIFVGLALIGVLVPGSIDEEEGGLEKTEQQEVVEQREEEKQEETEVSEEEEIVAEGTNKETEEREKVEEGLSSPYPRLTEETMDRNLILNCTGGDEVVLWDLPTSVGEGARGRDRVPCGTYGWAFNEYYNESLEITYYAINTLDERVDNAYGWVIEDFITWKD
jgi:hypothetical protein